jgi:hypothetical protein
MLLRGEAILRRAEPCFCKINWRRRDNTKEGIHETYEAHVSGIAKGKPAKEACAERENRD